MGKVKTLSNAYLSMFCTELMMLQNAGIAPYDGVLMLIEDERDKDGKAVLQSLTGVLSEGEPLSKALTESGYFPHYMIAMLEAGEETGRVTETLKALSAHYDRQEQISLSIRNAVMYPTILLILMITVVVILIVKVLPMFNDVFARLGSRLPPLAEGLMAFGQGLSGASAVIAIVVGALLVLAFIMWLIPAAKESVSKWFKNSFGDKGIMGDISSSRFASGLSLGIASGLDTEKALELAASISGGSKAVDEKHKECIAKIREGSTLSEAMHTSGIFSSRNSRMLSLGSRSGMTDQAIAEIADRSGRAVQENIDRLIGRVEPALVVTTSVIIGVILLSVMLPLMGIMTALG